MFLFDFYPRMKSKSDFSVFIQNIVAINIDKMVAVYALLIPKITYDYNI